MDQELRDLDAMIAELRAQLANAPPEMRGVLNEQIDSMLELRGHYVASLPSLEHVRSTRIAVHESVESVFTPQPVEPMPTWIPDGLLRSGAHESMLRCPPDAVITAAPSYLRCVLAAPAGYMPKSHGLTLEFQQSGGLRSQSMYERGCLRWHVDYHASGGRSTEGHYRDREPLVHVPHGLHTSYSASGSVITQSRWNEGWREGLSVTWDEVGNPLVAWVYAGGRVLEEIRPDGTRRPL